MARTLADLRTLMTEFMVLDLDNSKGESPSSANQNEQLNWAYRSLCRRAFLFDPSITFTLTASTSLYNIRDITTPIVSKKVIYPKWVYINNVPLRAYNNEVRGLWTLQELERDNPMWRSVASGTPYCAVLHRYNSLRLYPAPTSGVVSAGGNYIAGTYLPVDMSGDSDVPDLPEEFHELIAFSASIKASLPVVTEEEMWNRIKAYDGEVESMFKDFTAEQKTVLADWGTSGGYEERDYVYA